MMEESGKVVAPARRSSRQSIAYSSAPVKLEGQDVYPARVQGVIDVFKAPMFILIKARWVSDDEVSTCAACNAKFTQLRRKHHCRQCGLVFCSKCCKEKMWMRKQERLNWFVTKSDFFKLLFRHVPLPQLGCEEPERVCDQCFPITELVTKSRSPHVTFQLESAKGLAHAAKDPRKIRKLVELGGVQALITLSRIDSVHIRKHVTSGLHTLSTHQPLHYMLSESGAIKAVCKVLASVGDSEEDTLQDGISALLIFCKLQDLKPKALEDGALGPVLALCTHRNDTICLLAVSTLAHIAEHPGTHEAIVDSPKQALQRILALTASNDGQMQEVALKTLAHLSNGTDVIRHKIVQEDYNSGRCLQKALESKPTNNQVLCNAVCLVANLATCQDNQVFLKELMGLLGNLLQSVSHYSELLCQLTRALANFAQFSQNADKLIKYIPSVVDISLTSSICLVRMHGLRFLFSLLSSMPDQVTELLLSNGARQVLVGMGSIPGIMAAIKVCLLAEAPDRSRPQ